jgi:hypothetical protein
MQDHSLDGYYMAMRAKGFSRNTIDSVRKQHCPNCHFEFALVYGRTTACRGCAEVVNNCPKVRCPKCDHEWFIKDVSHINDKYRGRAVENHVSDVVTKYYEDNGWKKTR